ncbi:MAG: hypothetical protein V4562_08685 [Pseudomonadota bacterium]
MKEDLMQPAATIAGALLAANPNAMRDPDAIAKVFIATYRQLEKASAELSRKVVATKTPTAAAAAAASKAK